MRLSFIITFLLIFIITLIFNVKVDIPILWKSLLVGLSTCLIVYLINKNKYLNKIFEKEISEKTGCSILIIIPTIIIFLFMILSSSSPTIVNIEELSYKEEINHSYNIEFPKLKADEILWKKTFNENEAIVFFLNEEHTISLAKIIKDNNRWKAVVSWLPDKVENEIISSTWSILDNSLINDKSDVVSVRWGYIYSNEVEEVYVGSREKKNSLQEAQILEFSNYNIRLYYYLTDDKFGYLDNTIIAYNNSGDILYSNKD